MKKQVVLSGIRATGKMHIGNYLGALQNFAKLSQDETKESFFFVADLHTFTTQDQAALIQKEAPEIVLDILAAGVDPQKSTLYVQSHVPSVATLAWCLGCLASAGDLQRLPTFKDKAKKQQHNINAGLLFYPILMAADILGPKADLVPVGKDQKPHLEFTQGLARGFNLRYGNFFPIPSEMEEKMILVPGLVAMDNRGKFAKMGKSESPNETLYLYETAEQHLGKLLKAPTDPARQKKTDPGTPAKCALFQLHTLLSTNERIQWASEGCTTAGIGCGDCKTGLNESLTETLKEFRARRQELSEKKNMVQEIIMEGAKVASRVFQETTDYVVDKMGGFSAKIG